MKTIVKYAVAAMVAMVMAVGCAWVCIEYSIGYWAAPIVAWMFGGVSGMYVGEWIAMRLLDAISRKQTRYDSIRPTGRSYGQAAVFIGTACLYMGTPQQCDDVCDDLWHHGQQAHVEMLTGEETSFNVL